MHLQISADGHAQKSPTGSLQGWKSTHDPREQAGKTANAKAGKTANALIGTTRDVAKCDGDEHREVRAGLRKGEMLRKGHDSEEGESDSDDAPSNVDLCFHNNNFQCDESRPAQNGLDDPSVGYFAVSAATTSGQTAAAEAEFNKEDAAGNHAKRIEGEHHMDLGAQGSKMIGCKLGVKIIQAEHLPKMDMTGCSCCLIPAILRI